MIKAVLRSTLSGLAFVVVAFSLPAVQAEASEGAQVGSWSSGHRVDVYNGGAVGYIGSDRGVSCYSDSYCFAAFGDGKIAKLENGVWTKPARTVMDSGIGTSIFVTCSLPESCLAMDNVGDMYGLRPLMPKSNPVDPPGDISGLACPSSSFCVAVTLSGTELTYSGGKWSAPHSVDPISAKNTGLSSVSCPSISLCIAVDSVGAVLKYSDGKWSPPDRIDPQSAKNDGLGFVSVSCATSNFCMAIDSNGYGFSYSNGSWSKRMSFDTANADTPASVSCASPKFCVAVDWDGNAIDYIDGQWRSPNLIDAHVSIGGDQLTSVSCPSSKFCIAIDLNGYAFEYTKSKS